MLAMNLQADGTGRIATEEVIIQLMTNL